MFVHRPRLSSRRRRDGDQVSQLSTGGPSNGLEVVNGMTRRGSRSSSRRQNDDGGGGGQDSDRPVIVAVVNRKVRRAKEMEEIKALFGTLLVTPDIPGHQEFVNFVHRHFVGSNVTKKVETRNMFRDQLIALVKSAKKDALLHSDNAYGVYRMSEDIFCLVFHWCRELSVNLATFFRVIDMFDRLTLGIEADLKSTITTFGNNDKEVNKKLLLAKYAKEVHLQICSCIIIASKVHSTTDSPAVAVDEVQSKLKTLPDGISPNYSMETILKSELEVFRLLNFRTLWVNPFDIVEQILLILMVEVLRGPDQLPRFYALSMVYLEYSFIREAKLFQELQIVNETIWKEMGVDLRRERFVQEIECNAPLRAAGVIGAACFHLNLHEILVGKLAELVNEPKHRVSYFSVLLADMSNILPR